MAEHAAQQAPLRSLTVIDLGQIYNGSDATLLMAMAGARVIKIEPKGGEHLRRRASVGGAALPFAMLNSDKLSATLDLKTARGGELLRAMVPRADVLLENFAPGTMERLGHGWEALKQVIRAPSTHLVRAMDLAAPTGTTPPWT